MKFVVGENGRNPEETYPDADSSTMKPRFSYGDANSGPQRWVALDEPLAPRSRLKLQNIKLPYLLEMITSSIIRPS